MDINVAEATVVELQGSNATHSNASLFVLLAAGNCWLGSDPETMTQPLPPGLPFVFLTMDSLSFGV